MGVFAREPLGADARAAAYTHVLQHAIIDEGERLAVPRREQIDDAAIGARLAAVFLLRPIAVRMLGPEDDIGLHADGHPLVVRAFHRAPTLVAIFALAGKIESDARPVGRAAEPDLLERLLLDTDAILHGQEA